MKAIVRTMISAWHRLRLSAWTAKLRFKLWRMGGQLDLDAAPGVRFDSSPAFKAYPGGDGRTTFSLSLGRDAHLGRHMTIEVWTAEDSALEIGDGSAFLSDVRLLMRPGRILIGPKCTISDGVWLKSDGRLEIGAEVLIRQHSAIHCEGEVTLGDRVGIAENVSILDSDHMVDGSDTHYRSRPPRWTPVTLESNVLVSAGVVILRGTRIGRNSVVGANAVVRRGDYPPASVLAGNPAEVTRQLAESDGDIAPTELERTAD